VCKISKEKYGKKGNDKMLMKRMQEHYDEALEHFSKDRIVILCCQGSQNYKLDLPTSDLDTKLIVTPSFKDIALNKKPVSTTHIRVNEEHIDFKDVRLYVETFRKQNLNFLEILFTPYKIVNPLYADQWSRLEIAREQIARMNPYKAVKSMKGVALEKYHAMEHPYPSKLEVLAKYAYDPKQLHHLVRVDNYLTRYIAGDSYESSMVPTGSMRNFLLDIKKGKYNLAEARSLAAYVVDHVTKIADEFCANTKDKEDESMRQLLEDVSYNIMKISAEKEFGL
jgi:hypothetical protein